MGAVKLSVVVHTEEEFDWDAGFYRSNNQVTHGKELTEFCEQLIQFGANVVFAMDYAFVTSEQGQAVITHFKAKHAESVEFAAHLHPWVNPPFTDCDKVPEQESYPGNLPADIEFEKLNILTQAIEEQVGYRPTTYLAGRYGVGENTYKTLKQLGYKVDLSITPFTDYRHQQGPDFSNYDNREIIIDGIQCIPHSTGFISFLPFFTDWLNRKAGNLDKLNSSFIGKVILKLSGVKKVRLSPEGFNSDEIIKLTNSLKRIGICNLIFSFHSPSSKVGLTPYTENIESKQCFEHSSFTYLKRFRYK